MLRSYRFKRKDRHFGDGKDPVPVHLCNEFVNLRVAGIIFYAQLRVGWRLRTRVVKWIVGFQWMSNGQRYDPSKNSNSCKGFVRMLLSNQRVCSGMKYHHLLVFISRCSELLNYLFQQQGPPKEANVHPTILLIFQPIVYILYIKILSRKVSVPSPKMR